MQSLGSSWNHVSKETVIYCFQKANFSKKDQMSTVNDVDNPFKDLNKSAKELQTKDPSLVAENMTV